MKKLLLFFLLSIFYFTNSYADGCTYSICTEDMICDQPMPNGDYHAFGSAEIHAIEIMIGCDIIILDDSYNINSSSPNNCTDCVFRFPYLNINGQSHTFLEVDFNKWLIANNYQGNLSVSYNFAVDTDCRGTYFEFAGVDFQIVSISASEGGPNPDNPCFQSPAQSFPLEENGCTTETCDCTYSFCPEEYGCDVLGIGAQGITSENPIFDFPYSDYNTLVHHLNIYLAGDGCASTQICEKEEEVMYDFTWEGCGPIDIDDLGNQAMSYNSDAVCSNSPQGLLHATPPGPDQGINLKLNTQDIKYFDLEFDFIVNENYAILFRGRNNKIIVELRNGRIHYEVENTTGLLNTFYPNGTEVQLRVSYAENNVVTIKEINAQPAAVPNIFANNLFGAFMQVGLNLDGTGNPSMDNFKLTKITPERLGLVIQNTCTEFYGYRTSCGLGQTQQFETTGDCSELELDDNDNESSNRSAKNLKAITSFQFQNPSSQQLDVKVSMSTEATLHAYNLTGEKVISADLTNGDNTIQWQLPQGLNILIIEKDGIILENKKVMIID